MVNVNDSFQNGNIDEALELAEEIQELAEELPERAEDFGISVMEQAADIAKQIEETGRVTVKQVEALRNMKAGIENWLNH